MDEGGAGSGCLPAYLSEGAAIRNLKFASNELLISFVARDCRCESIPGFLLYSIQQRSAVVALICPVSAGPDLPSYSCGCCCGQVVKQLNICLLRTG